MRRNLNNTQWGFAKPELRIVTSFPQLLTLDFLRFLFSRVTNCSWISDQSY